MSRPTWSATSYQQLRNRAFPLTDGIDSIRKRSRETRTLRRCSQDVAGPIIAANYLASGKRCPDLIRPWWLSDLISLGTDGCAEAILAKASGGTFLKSMPSAHAAAALYAISLDGKILPVRCLQSNRASESILTSLIRCEAPELSCKASQNRRRQPATALQRAVFEYALLAPFSRQLAAAPQCGFL